MRDGYGFFQATRFDQHPHRRGTAQHFFQSWHGALARSTVKVLEKGYAVAAVSFGTSNRTGPRLPLRLLHRPLPHRTSSVNNNRSWPVGKLHPRRLPVANTIPLLPKVVVVAGGTRFNALCAYPWWWCPHPTRHRLLAGATFTSKVGGENSSFLPGILRL